MLLATLLGGSGAAQAQTTHDVNLDVIVFLPADIMITVGDTVHWVWVNGLHNVESGIIDGNLDGVHDSNFRSGDVTSVVGTTFDQVFDQVFLDANPMPNDTYPYYCIQHTNVLMAGTITVVGEPAIPAASEWGLIAMALLVAVVGTILVLRRHSSYSAI